MLDWKTQIVLFADLKKVMLDARKSDGKPQRAGQAAFNHLHCKYPEIANKIRGTEADCFYDNAKIPAFMQRLYDLCNPEEPTNDT